MFVVLKFISSVRKIKNKKKKKKKGNSAFKNKIISVNFSLDGKISALLKKIRFVVYQIKKLVFQNLVLVVG